MILRTHPRFVVRYPVTLSGDLEGEAVITNLSVGGCQVEQAHVSAPVNARLLFHMASPHHEVPAMVRPVGRVRWSRPPHFGVEFVEDVPPGVSHRVEG